MIFLLPALILAIWAPREESFNLNLPCPGEPQLVLSKIINTADETIAEMYFVSANDYRETIGIGVYPPGHEKAFFIAPAKKRTKKKFALLRVEGIPLRPDGAKLDIGEQLTFRLVFEKVPLKTFNLIEGTAKLTDSTAWNFTDVALDR